MIIEKDTEYDEEDTDCTDREYFPIRVVKSYNKLIGHCRKLVIDSYNRRGRTIMKKTNCSLHNIGQKIQQQN